MCHSRRYIFLEFPTYNQLSNNPLLPMGKQLSLSLCLALGICQCTAECANIMAQTLILLKCRWFFIHYLAPGKNYFSRLEARIIKKMMLFFGLVKLLLADPNLTFVQETHQFRGHVPWSQGYLWMGGFTVWNLVWLGIIFWRINFSVTDLFYILIHFLAMWSQWSDHVLVLWKHRHDPNVLFL